MSRYFSFRARSRSLVIAVALGLLLTGIFASLARADGTPDISASISSSSTLYGNEVHVQATASNPQGQPYGYNLSFRVVLPAGVDYAGGAPVAPRQIAGAPNPGETTLIFENVSDLSPGSTRELPFELEYDQSIYDAGASFPVKMQAFVNKEARFIPKSTPKGCRRTNRPATPASPRS